MSAVAGRAEVGQASLYRRYPTKELLLTEVADRGMRDIRDRALAAARHEDPESALTEFLGWYVDSGALRLSGLLGVFAPPERLFVLAREANEAIQVIVDRAAAAGVIRTDVTGADMTLIAAQIAGVELGNPERTRVLRRRYLTLALRGLTFTGSPDLPGPPPNADELEAPWRSAERRQP
jgi:AcrR family transcriptional regulator